MANPAIGEGPCPLGSLAGEPHKAELCREEKGRRALYLRCEECGGIQTRAPEGQRRIKAMIKAGTLTIYSREEAAELAGFEAEEEAKEEHRKASKGLLGWLVSEDNETE